MNAAEQMLDARFHIAQGAKPAEEKGLDSQIRLYRHGTKWVGLVTLNTQAGPISLAASADEKVISALLTKCVSMRSALPQISGKSEEYNGSYSLMNLAKVQNSAQKIAQQVAMQGVRAKVGALPNAAKEAAASHLYVRLTQKDPSAWQAMGKIVSKAKAGDKKALAAWASVVKVHLKRHTIDTSKGTTGEKAAAVRLYARLFRNDPTAWDALMTIATGAEKGDQACIRAWGMLANVYEQQVATMGAMKHKHKHGHANANGKVGTQLGTRLGVKLGTQLGTQLGTRLGTRLGMRLGTRLGASVAVALSPDREAQLLAQCKAARASSPKISGSKSHEFGFWLVPGGGRNRNNGGRPSLRHTLQAFFETVYDASPADVQAVLRDPTLLKATLQDQIKNMSNTPQVKAFLAKIHDQVQVLDDAKKAAVAAKKAVNDAQIAKAVAVANPTDTAAATKAVAAVNNAVSAVAAGRIAGMRVAGLRVGSSRATMLAQQAQLAARNRTAAVQAQAVEAPVRDFDDDSPSWFD